MTDLEVWIKQREGKPGAIREAAKLFGITTAEVRQAYDRVYRLSPEAVPEIKKEEEPMLEKPVSPTHEERAARYAQLRTDGLNPDEAAQEIGYKNFVNMQSTLVTRGIRTSTRAPYLLPPDAPRRTSPKAKTAEPDMPAPAPPRQLIPDRMALEDKPSKPSLLRPCCWYGESFLYTDTGDYIEIKPHGGNNSIRLTYEALKQFSEEINEILEIIK